jgi:PPOX class probable F420-dependent enzyme
MASLEDVRRLAAAEHGLAVVATARTDGSVQASVVNAGVLRVDGRDVVAFVVQGGSVKLTNLRRNPNVTAVFRAGWQWTAVEGTAEIIGPDDASAATPPDRVPGLLRDVFTAAGGTHDDWAEYDRVMAAERRAAVLVTPTRIYGNA